MSVVLAALVGLGLAAACGFRVFVPLLVVAVASRAGHLTIAPSLAWIGSNEAIIAFGTATMLEIVAYKVPWLDHTLDLIASPAAVVAGALVAASQIGTLSGSGPGGGLLMWSSAIIGGGGVAALVQSATVGTRAVSTATTAGLANPIINLGQSIVSVALSVASIVAPFVVVATLLVVGLIGWRVVAKSRLTRARATRTLA